MNLYELGLYLPGINAILHGSIPYRDFFYLRGPFELYVPALMMKLWGTNVAVLSLYFYVGTVMTLIMCVLIAAQVMKSRLFLYTGVAVLIARTFPRVVFTYWGGMRFVLGLASIFFLIISINDGKKRWLFLSGFCAALAIFTSFEIGVCSFLSAFVFFACRMFQDRRDSSENKKKFFVYLFGALAVIVPYVLYLLFNQALLPYWESTWTVLTNMPKVIDTHLSSQYPRTLWESFLAMINPTNENFRHLTPVYLYLTAILYLFVKFREQRISPRDLKLTALGAYAVILYIVSFRALWGSQFEMALQPEKILWFCVLEFIFLKLLIARDDPRQTFFETFLPLGFKLNTAKRTLINALLALMISLSIGNALLRYHRRFFVGNFTAKMIGRQSIDDLKPLAKDNQKFLSLDRARGMVVPVWQAQEMEAIVSIVHRSVGKDESVMFYPELGIYNFLADRSFVGKHPVPLFSWFSESWHREFVDELNEFPPKLIVIPKEFPPEWLAVYLAPGANKMKYAAVLEIVKRRYLLIEATPQSRIYQRKDLKK